MRKNLNSRACSMISRAYSAAKETNNQIRFLLFVAGVAVGLTAWAHQQIGDAADERAAIKEELKESITENSTQIAVMQAHYENIIASLDEVKERLPEQ